MRRFAARITQVLLLPVVLASCSDVLTAPVPNAGGTTEPAFSVGDGSVTTTFFGPERFVRRPGQPVVETRQIEVTAGGPHTIHVRNGDANGRNRTSSAVITVDGRPVFTQQQWNQNVASLSAPLELGAAAVLTVQVTGNASSEITVWITGDASDMTFRTTFQSPGGPVEREHRAIAGEATPLDVTGAGRADVVATATWQQGRVTLHLERLPDAGNLPVLVAAERDAAAGDDRVISVGTSQLQDRATFTVDADAGSARYVSTTPDADVRLAATSASAILGAGRDVAIRVLDAPLQVEVAIPAGGARTLLGASDYIGQAIVAVSSGTATLLPATHGGDPTAPDRYSYTATPAGFDVAYRLSAISAMSIDVAPVDIALTQHQPATRTIALTAEVDDGSGASTVSASLERPGASTAIAFELSATGPIRVVVNNSHAMQRLAVTTSALGGVASSQWQFDNLSRRLSACLDSGAACMRPNPHAVQRYATPATTVTSFDFDDHGTHGAGTGPAFRTTLDASIERGPDAGITIQNLRFRNVALDFQDANSAHTSNCGVAPRLSAFVDSRGHPFVIGSMAFGGQIQELRMGTDVNPARAGNRIARVNGWNTGIIGCLAGPSTSSAGGLAAGGQLVFRVNTAQGTINALQHLNFSFLPLGGGTVSNPQPW